MNNYNKNNRVEKAQLSKIDIETLKIVLTEKETELKEQKQNLGYGSLTKEEFLGLSPQGLGQAESSQLEALQNAFKQLEDERHILYAEEYVTVELNNTHAAIHTDQFYILTEKDDPIFGGKSFVLESKQSFKSLYENKLVMCPDGRMRTKADIWLKNPLRREYRGITFNPNQKELSDNLYNIWKGFAKKPIESGAALKFWEHTKHNICAGDEEAYIYVRKWLACVFQHPDQVHTALVLQGSQGVGKNSFVNPLGVLLGQHYAPLGNISELVSHFNFHLKNAVLIHANESFWGGHKSEVGILKTMITEETCLIEAKGKDRILVQNYKHLIVSSNEDWPVALDADDRRFFVLRVSEAHKEDHLYFKAIQEELNNGGYEALLYDLLHENLNGFNPRKFPTSPHSFDIKLKSLNSAYSYIYEALLYGYFVIATDDVGGIWQSEIPKSHVYNDYVAWCKNSGEKAVTNGELGKVIKKLIPSINGEARLSSGNRGRLYSLPELSQARQEFCNAFKETNRLWEKK